MDNNGGNWANPPKMADTSDASWGGESLAHGPWW
jgi:hypothetical protein